MGKLLTCCLYLFPTQRTSAQNLYSLSNANKIREFARCPVLRNFIRLSLFFVFLPAIATTAVGQESIVAITHVNVIDATGTPVQTDMTVIVQGKQLMQIGKSDATPLPKTATVVDGIEKVLITGLWDMHVPEIFGTWL